MPSSPPDWWISHPATRTEIPYRPALSAHRADAGWRAVRLARQSDRHAGARALESAGNCSGQACLEREADRQFAGRGPGVACPVACQGASTLGRTNRRAKPSVRIHGPDVGGREARSRRRRACQLRASRTGLGGVLLCQGGWQSAGPGRLQLDIRLVTWVDANAPDYGSYFGRRNIAFRDRSDFRPVPTLESALGDRPE